MYQFYIFVLCQNILLLTLCVRYFILFETDLHFRKEFLSCVFLQKGFFMTRKEMITNDKIGSATVVQHEDAVLKIAAQFFAKELLPYLGIDGKVISSAPTESIVLNLKKFYEDINLIQKERFLQAFSLTENTKDIPSEDLQKIEAMIYTMADKFLENDDFEHVKEGIRMTRLGQMLFNDGFNDGFNNGSQKKQLEIARNLIGKLSDASIAETTGLPLDVILKLKKEQTMKV